MNIVLMFSHVWLFETPWTVGHLPPLSMEFFQASTGEQVAISSSRGSSRPRGSFWTQESNLRLLCFLHEQAYSLPLVSPGKLFLDFQINSIDLYIFSCASTTLSDYCRFCSIEFTILLFWILLFCSYSRLFWLFPSCEAWRGCLSEHEVFWEHLFPFPPSKLKNRYMVRNSDSTKGFTVKNKSFFHLRSSVPLFRRKYH